MSGRLLVLLLCGCLLGCTPPRHRAAPVPVSQEDLDAQAFEDCRFYRLSPYLAPTGEEGCLQRRLQALQTIAGLRSDPAFLAAQEACAFVRGSPTEERCYQRSIQEGRRPSLGTVP
jgi:hypothetical protein